VSKYFFLPLLILAACTNGYKADYEVEAELQLIDTLQARLSTIKGWLDKMPLEEVLEREDIIAHNLTFIDQSYKETGLAADEETLALLEEYKSYGLIYARTADHYTGIVTDMEELLIQIKTLKASAHSKDYKKETFLKYFKEEKEAVLNLFSQSEAVLKPAIDTDLSFERAQQRVEGLAESLKSEKVAGHK
jgi:hypothetical protein